MQNQYNSIEDNNDVKFLLYIKKLQNITEVGTLVSDKIALSTKNIINKKRVDNSVRKVICIIS